MSSKTKIVVLKARELIYTGIFILLGILLILLLIFMFVPSHKSKKTKDRLEILNKTNDGFKIAEEDLKLRGPGDFFGVRQSGDFDFGIADIYTDAKVLKSASEAAGEVLDKDPELELEENRYLAEKVSEYTVKCLEKLNI